LNLLDLLGFLDLLNLLYNKKNIIRKAIIVKD
jgi:hypothetical protein